VLKAKLLFFAYGWELRYEVRDATTRRRRYFVTATMGSRGEGLLAADSERVYPD
jgi:hypothetical protein